MSPNLLGKTGLQVSPLGFGAAPIGYLATGPERTSEILHRLLDSGVNVIDTAACYPGSEEAIGRAIGRRRDEYVLVTKCGHRVEGARGEEWSAGLITASVDRSLRRLRTDRIDVMLLHSCGLDILEKGEALAAVLRARDAGKVLWVGYSGDNREALHAARLPEVAVLEVSVNICDQANLDQVVPEARRNEVGLLAKRPLANAAWRPLECQPGLYAEYAETYTERLRRMDLKPAELGFEGDPDDAWPELALRFTLSQPGVATALAGTTNPERIRANVEAAARGPLPAAVVARIRSAFRRAEAASGERWPGET